jgi:hypothetical protein
MWDLVSAGYLLTTNLVSRKQSFPDYLDSDAQRLSRLSLFVPTFYFGTLLVGECLDYGRLFPLGQAVKSNRKKYCGNADNNELPNHLTRKR